MESWAKAVLETIETKAYDPLEQEELLAIFTDMLRLATADGGRKREAETKVSWKVDPEHEQGLFAHIARWKRGEARDPDSGAHPLVHVAWRCLALAYQEQR